MIGSILHRIFIHNLRYKISALLLSFLTWYLVQSGEILEIDRRASITVHVPEGYIVAGEGIKLKDVTLKGSRLLLGEYVSGILEADLYITERAIKKYRLRIGKEHFKNWDDRVELIVHDPYVNVSVDEVYSKNIPIKEVTQGIPAESFSIEKVQMEPSSIVVTGAKSEILKLKEIYTETIDIDGLQQSKSIEVPLATKGADSSLAFAQETVKVNVQIGERKINRRFSNIAIEASGNEHLADIRPKYITVVIQGTPGVLSFIRSSDVQAFVDLRNIQPGKYEKSVQIKIPPDTVLIETFPENVAVELYNQKKID